MTITTQHASSSYGIPVILDDDGNVMDYEPGIKSVRARLSLTQAELAEKCGVSPRSVQGWEQGRDRVPAAALNVMSDLLRTR